MDFSHSSWKQINCPRPETELRPTERIEFSEEMKPGQLTHQSKEAVSKPGHVNNLCYWIVNLKVNCCYKTTLIGCHPIKIACKAICLQGNHNLSFAVCVYICNDRLWTTNVWGL